MPLVDHLAVLLIAVVYPVVGFFSYRRLVARVRAGEAVDRSTLYRATVIGHWSLFVMVLAIWALADRPWPVLGFSFDLDERFLAALLLTVVAVAALIFQLRQVRRADIDTLRKYRREIGDVDIVLPQSGGELLRFYGVSVTAGVVEETLWRGYLIWYLALFMPLWLAATLSVIGFGLGHAYQGFKNLPKVTAVGAVFTGLYLLAGSLWLPIILHALVDILQGRLAYGILQKTNASGAAPTEPPVDGESGSVPAEPA